MFDFFTKIKKENNSQHILPSQQEQQFLNQRKYFRLPIDKKCSIQLIIGNLTSSWGDCHLVNVSAGGAQIIAPYRFPVSHSDIKVRIQFELEEKYTLVSEIVWSQQVHNLHQYGLKWIIDNVHREKIEQELLYLQINHRKSNVHGVH